MQANDHRYDISDRIWDMLEPKLMGRKGTWGGNARDNRQFINGVFWILRTGAPWRSLPPEYGSWKNAHRRFCRWRDKGEWERLFTLLENDPEFEWLMMNASYVKVCPHEEDADGRQDMGETKKGLAPRYIWPWTRMVRRSDHWMAN